MKAKVIIKPEWKFLEGEPLWEFDYDGDEDYRVKREQLRELLSRVRFEEKEKTK